MERRLPALPAPNEPPAGMPVTGIGKAAVLMVALGDGHAKEVYKQLSEQEIERLTQEIASLQAVSPEVSQAVLEEFHELVETQQYLAFGGPEYAKRILVETFGNQRAEIVRLGFQMAILSKNGGYCAQRNSLVVFERSGRKVGIKSGQVSCSQLPESSSHPEMNLPIPYGSTLFSPGIRALLLYVRPKQRKIKLRVPLYELAKIRRFAVAHVLT